jgi:hypothetical protein
MGTGTLDIVMPEDAPIIAEKTAVDRAVLLATSAGGIPLGGMRLTAFG